jgi:hypothetical protein
MPSFIGLAMTVKIQQAGFGSTVKVDKVPGYCEERSDEAIRQYYIQKF